MHSKGAKKVLWKRNGSVVKDIQKVVLCALHVAMFCTDAAANYSHREGVNLWMCCAFADRELNVQIIIVNSAKRKRNWFAA